MKFPIRYSASTLYSLSAFFCTAAGLTLPSYAEETIEEVIVTAVPKGSTRLEASVSVSAMDAEDTFKVAPRSIAEVFRSLPGIRSESSGGTGNANITIRGIPLATGGSKFLQIQEDGLPVVEFGDINFGNVDNWIRHDWSIGRVESIRGGSASTFASNSPGGVINLISNTGEDEGGSVGITAGADYDEFRFDFAYGGPINESMRFHIAGYVRDGEGVRETGYNGDSGRQIKANLTKDLDNGYIRFYAKALDDNATTYLPAPVRVKSNGDFDTVPNFDARDQTLHSAFNTNISTFDAFGNPRNRDLKDGLESEVDAFGFEANLEIAEGLTLLEKFRTSDITGGFISPFTDTFGDFGPQPAADMAAAICASALDGDGNPFDCSSTMVTIANGGGVGNQYDGLAFLNLLFDTSINDLGSIINDTSLTRDFDNGVSVTVGFYYSKQNISTSWNSWQTFIQTVDGSNSQLLHIVDGSGNILVDNGLWVPSFLSFEWDLDYQITAPYFNVGFEVGEKWLFDISARRDEVQANGELVSSCCGGNTDFDLNGNGVIDGQAEDASSTNGFGFGGGVINLNRAGASVQQVDYEEDDVSFSIGGSYLLDENSTLFARYSEGVRAIADRLLQIAGSLNADGSLSSTTDGFDTVDQLEVGYKYVSEGFDFYATLFDTTTEDTQAELTSGTTFMREYEATGIELEGIWRITDNFTLDGNVTWTDAEISDDVSNPALEGNTPRRQADFIWTLTSEYAADRFAIGATLQGSDEYFVQDNNDLRQDAYNIIHLFGRWHIAEDLTASLNVNNITDEFVITESEEGSANPGDIIRARPLSGRSTSISLRYDF